ncbi:MAG: nitronate monooxygenase [Clostridia bacterium]|nr:nitronate monooxygenase [Clostridia bacterium]
MSSVKIADKILRKPIIQGGMGIGVSRSALAGAVAKEGGMGVISAAQVGYDSPLFKANPDEANLQTLPLEIKKAKDISENNGMIAVNIMSVTQQYGTYAKTATQAGADAIISGAGLPLDLPEYVKDTNTKIASVVSSKKAAELMMKAWDRKYGRCADFLVMESPFSGGHQGYSHDPLSNLEDANQVFEEDVRQTVEVKKTYEEKYGRHIPIFVAGGIFNGEDVQRALSLGADGVQVGTRFIATKECDAADAYKQVFVNANPEDWMIIQSPVGMPARVIRNAFVERMLHGKEKISYCYNCLKACNPGKAKYCISQALIDAVKGDVDNGLIFCNTKVGQIKEILTVKELMEELVPST